MRQVSFLKRPSRRELMEKLKEDFGNDCSYRFFGFGPLKRIIVSKSPFIAVQISYRGEKKVLIEGTYASILVATLIQTIYNFFSNAAHSTPATRKSWKMLEEDIVAFLAHRFK